MSLSADHKALLFVGVIAVLGGAVRVVRWSTGGEPVGDQQPALEHQLGATDSAAHAGRRPKGKRTRSPTSARRVARVDSGRGQGEAPMWRNTPGYVLGRLDLDAATQKQIEALPGIGPSLAKRIVTDRAEHGPFVNLAGFGRVKGVGPALLRRLDTLVTFSATLRPLNATPESVSTRSTSRGRTRR